MKFRLAPPKSLSSEGLRSVLPWLLVAFYWVVNHRYEGLRHDGWLYALMAVARNEPGRYAGDLALVGGEQASATAFVPLYGMLVAFLGIDAASRCIVLVGGLLWVAAAVMLARQLLPPGWPATLGALLLVTASTHYSPNGVTFALQENFATPRILALPLGMLGIAAGLRGRDGIAVALGLLSTLLHPLNGIWSLCLVIAGRLPASIAVPLAPTFVAALLLGHRILPIGTLQPIDPEWEHTVRAMNPDAIPGRVGEFRFGEYMFWVILLLTGVRLGSSAFRQFYLVLALLAAWATLLSLLSSFWSPVWLVLAAQPWRVLWLAQVIGLLAACDVLLRGIRMHPAGWAPCAVGVMAVWAGNEMRWMVPAAAMLVASLEPGRRLFARCLDAAERRPRMTRGALMLVALLLAPPYLLELSMLGGFNANPGREEMDALRGFLLDGGGGAGVAAVAWLVHRHGWELRASIAAGMLLGVSLLLWDARQEKQRSLEESWFVAAHRYPPRPGDLVAWPGQSPRVWFVMGTGQYADTWQTSGLIFSRERMLETRRRLDRMSEISSPNGVRILCGDEILDWVVTSGPGSGPESAALEIDGFRFHSCKLVRAAAVK